MAATKKNSFMLSRAWLLRELPFLAKGIASLYPVPTPGLLDKGTKGWAMDMYGRIYYDPLVFESQKISFSGTAISHEFEHWFKKHFLRYARLSIKISPRWWNICTDAEINNKPFYRKYLDDDCIFPEQFDWPRGKLAEEYALLIPPEPEEGEGREEGEGEGGEGPGQPGNNPGQSPGEGDDHGSVVDGKPREWELGPPSPQNPGWDELDQEMITRGIAKDIRDAIARGDGAASYYEDFANSVLEPAKVRWETELSRLLRVYGTRALGAQDWTYQKRNRRQHIFGDVVFPAPYKPQINVAFISDQSGSMCNDVVKQGFSEIQGLIRASGAAVTVLATDTKANVRQGVTDARSLKRERAGGTDLRVGIKAALDLQTRPNLIVVHTDGETPWPTTAPRVPVIVVLTRPESRYYRVPSWAKKITME